MSEDMEYRCFIGGLSWSTTDRGLKDAFEKFGHLLEAKVMIAGNILVKLSRVIMLYCLYYSFTVFISAPAFPALVLLIIMFWVCKKQPFGT